MPEPLYDEVNKYVETSDYETVSHLCRAAAMLLIEHYGLRPKDDQAEK